MSDSNGTAGTAPQPTPMARNGGRKSSRYRGVARLSNGRKRPWMVQIAKRKGERQTIVGYFADEEEAARAWDREARLCGRPRSQLNFPDETDSILPARPVPSQPDPSPLVREIEAIRAIAAVLDGLDGAACRRVLAYVGYHHTGD